MLVAHRLARSFAVLSSFATLVAACTATSADADRDPCAQAAAMCPRIASDVSCSPMLACESKCLLATGCDLGAPFMACVGDCNRAYGSTPGSDETNDAGPSDGRTSTTVDAPPPGSGEDTAPPATGGGGAGCTTSFDDYSCTCIPGSSDDGKGCSPSSLAAPAGCCATSSRCSCDVVSCTTSDSGCVCGLDGAKGTTPTATSCTGALCCAYDASDASGPGVCICWNHPGTGGCNGGREVSSCGADTTPCFSADEHSVSTCGGPSGGSDAGSGGA